MMVFTVIAVVPHTNLTPHHYDVIVTTSYVDDDDDECVAVFLSLSVV